MDTGSLLHVAPTQGKGALVFFASAVCRIGELDQEHSAQLGGWVGGVWGWLGGWGDGGVGWVSGCVWVCVCGGGGGGGGHMDPAPAASSHLEGHGQ